MITLILSLLLSYGALLVPLLYLIFTGWRGKAKKKLMVGIACQSFFIIFGHIVWRIVDLDSAQVLWIPAIFILSNIACLIWYLKSIFETKKEEDRG